jgi:hypothetical protein
MTNDLGVVERLQEATDAVNTANLPADLRSAGLVLAFWAGGAVRTHQTTRQEAGTPSGLAEQLGVDSAVLDRIYEVDEDQVALILPRRALNKSKSTAMAEIAHLVVAARQSLGHGDWITAETVRHACEDMGVLDGNFGRTLQQLHGEGFRVRGNGVQRELRMNAAGYEATAALIQRVVASKS